MNSQLVFGEFLVTEAAECPVKECRLMKKGDGEGAGLVAFESEHVKVLFVDAEGWKF